MCVEAGGGGCEISWRGSSDVCGIPGLLHGCWDPNSYPHVCMEVILIAMPPSSQIFFNYKITYA